MIRIVQGVQEITVERVDVLKARKAVDGSRQPFGKGFGSVFDFPGVEGPDSANFKASANLRGKSPLSTDY